MRYMICHGHFLLIFLPVGAAELEEGNEEKNLDESTLLHGSASSKAVPL